MKYKEHLRANIAPEYGSEPYLDYRRLDDIIRILSGEALSSANQTNRQVSLTVPPQTDATGNVSEKEALTEEAFFRTLDAEISKVEQFTLDQVTSLRNKLDEAEDALNAAHNAGANEEDLDAVTVKADKIGEEFLRLEKYVNLNFMGCHKILKKHDKYLKNNPCKAFYVSRMHGQAWVRGDYSDLVVRLSNIYSDLRNDKSAEEKDQAGQSFIRSTSKYWIKTEDVSRVKYAILRHLPVFLQKTSTGESDSQMTNSVYLDNDQLELYHGRLDKTPDAIALRFRWYGANEPKTVFVERKTHRDKWTGEVSVKERFIISEPEVEQILNSTYPVEDKRTVMEAKGHSREECDEWELLVREVMQVCGSKQLVPTMRTQYMRTAFQIPFDATVRVSLDTNLCMITERGYDLKGGRVWHRDPHKALQNTEINRFPHAILEIKLELRGAESKPPKWVEDLQHSGLLYEVHKFSKYIHGCATLLPEDVRSVPYWVDDASIRDSLIACGADRILCNAEEVSVDTKTVVPGANSLYPHLLPFGSADGDKMDAKGRTASLAPVDEAAVSKREQSSSYKGIDFYHDEEGSDDDAGDDMLDCRECCSWPMLFCCPGQDEIGYAPTRIQKVEPKVYFANERTFLHWLHAGIILSTIATGILAFASEEEHNSWAHWYALALLPISLGYCAFALHIFLWRADRIKTRIPGRWDDPRGPMLLGGLLVVVLTINFIVKLYEFAEYDGYREL